MTDGDYSKIKSRYCNAQTRLATLETKFQKRVKRISALTANTAQLEGSLPGLRAELDQAKHELRASRAAYHAAQRERKALSNR